MGMNINIKNIRVNSISTLGSMNIGKVVFSQNKASSMQLPKSNYEENEVTKEEIEKMVPLPPLPTDTSTNGIMG